MLLLETNLFTLNTVINVFFQSVPIDEHVVDGVKHSCGKNKAISAVLCEIIEKY